MFAQVINNLVGISQCIQQMTPSIGAKRQIVLVMKKRLRLVEKPFKRG